MAPQVRETDPQLFWIGWPGDEVDYEKQPELKKLLIDESSYVPVFLTGCVRSWRVAAGHAE